MTDGDASGRFPTSLSPSRAGDFTTCPLLFRFRSIDRLSEEPSAAAVRGTLVHRVLEWLFDLPVPERNPEAGYRLLEDAVQELARDAPGDLDALRPEPMAEPQIEATGLIDNYFELEDPRRLEPHAREVSVSATVDDGFILRGFVDRVDRTSDGMIRIVDYKTGRAPSEAFAGKAMFQMRFYGLTWWRMTGDVPRLLQLMYLGSRSILRYEPEVDDLIATERRVLALRDAISRAADSGEFLPTPSKLCDWCSHRALCPAWGGTPPPLPDRTLWPTAMSTRRTSPEAEGVAPDPGASG